MSRDRSKNGNRLRKSSLPSKSESGRALWASRIGSESLSPPAIPGTDQVHLISDSLPRCAGLLRLGHPNAQAFTRFGIGVASTNHLTSP